MDLYYSEKYKDSDHVTATDDIKELSLSFEYVFVILKHMSCNITDKHKQLISGTTPKVKSKNEKKTRGKNRNKNTKKAMYKFSICPYRNLVNGHFKFIFFNTICSYS